jgi:two-component system sensor histidine kinase/response regulator
MSNETILTVDDEDMILQIITDLLSSKGYKVITAKNGKEAIRKSKKCSPDLIVMDIMMPDLDGPEAAKLLKENPSTRDIPILFLSGIVMKEQGKSEQEINVGGEFYSALAKPFDADELLNTVHKLLE